MGIRDMEKLRSFVENTDTFAGKCFDLFFQFLILFSIISFSLETVPELEIYENIFSFLETVIVILFTIEYSLRILVSKEKFGFIFSFYGIIDFLAIAPFYISMGIDIRSIRVLRFFRLFRLLKFARYTKAMERMKIAFSEIRDELTIYFMLTILLVYLSGVGIYYFENSVQPEHFRLIFHSMWWAVATLTTVGYGDVYPITVGGRIFTFFILMLGLGLVSVPSGLIASAMTKREGK